MFGHNAPIIDISYNHKRKRLLVSDQSSNIAEWCSDTGRHIKTITYCSHNYPGAYIEKIKFLKNGDKHLTYSTDYSIKLWDITSMAPINSYDSPYFDILDMDLDIYDNKVIGCSSLGSIIHFNLFDRHKYSVIDVHSSIVNSVRYSKDNNFFITSSDDGSFKEFESETNKLFNQKFYKNRISKALYCNNDKLIIIQETMGNLLVLDASTYMLKKQLKGTFSFLEQDDTKTYIFIHDIITDCIFIYNVLNFELKFIINGSIDSTPLYLTTDENVVAILFKDCTKNNSYKISLWDIETKGILNRFAI